MGVELPVPKMHQIVISQITHAAWWSRVSHAILFESVAFMGVQLWGIGTALTCVIYLPEGQKSR